MMKILLSLLVLVILALVSIVTGVSAIDPVAFLSGDADAQQILILFASRIPRTMALVLAGSAMAISGLLLQMLARNRFVEPDTIGTMEAASLGLLTTLVLWPSAPIIVKMSIAALFALGSTALFLRILSMIRMRDVLIVPLVGLMLSGIIESVTSFFAYRFEIMQALGAWRTGDFSSVLRGRYELLWLTFGLTTLAYITADRFTVAGLGESFSTNLGLNYRRILALGLAIMSAISAIVIVTVGSLPFLGLIVPNVVRMAVGDNMRRGLPYVAILGAILVLASDIVGRIIRFPYEIPIGTVMGVVGSIIFLYLLLRRKNANV